MSSRLEGPNDGCLRVGRLGLALRPPDRRAADDDRAGAAVVADGQVAPVRQQRLGVGPEHAAEVRGVLERRVEVDVVGDREREQRLDVGERDRLPRRCRGHRLLGHALPGGATLRQQLVERAGAEVDDRLAGAEAEMRGAAALRERPEALGHRTPSSCRSPTGSKKEQLPTATSCSRRTRSSSSAPASRSRQRRPPAAAPRPPRAHSRPRTHTRRARSGSRAAPRPRAGGAGRPSP